MALNVKDEKNINETKEKTLSPKENIKISDEWQQIEYNSADTVRQTMKAVLSGNAPPYYTKDVPGHTELISVNEMGCSRFIPTGHYVRSISTSRTKIGEKTTKRLTNTRSVPQNLRTDAETSNLKRRKPPAKTVPSKKLKKDVLCNMYVGRLSNLMSCKHRYQSETSDSGLDSDYF